MFPLQLHPGSVVLAPIIPVQLASPSSSAAAGDRRYQEVDVGIKKNSLPYSVYKPAEVTQICHANGGVAMVRFFDLSAHSGVVAVPVSSLLHCRECDIPQLRAHAQQEDVCRFYKALATQTLKRTKAAPLKRERSDSEDSHPVNLHTAPTASSDVQVVHVGDTVKKSVTPTNLLAAVTIRRICDEIVNTLSSNSWTPRSGAVHAVMFRDLEVLLHFRETLIARTTCSPTMEHSIFVASDGEMLVSQGGPFGGRVVHLPNGNVHWLLCTLDDVLWKSSTEATGGSGAALIELDQYVSPLLFGDGAPQDGLMRQGNVALSFLSQEENVSHADTAQLDQVVSSLSVVDVSGGSDLLGSEEATREMLLTDVALSLFKRARFLVHEAVRVPQTCFVFLDDSADAVRRSSTNNGQADVADTHVNRPSGINTARPSSSMHIAPLLNKFSHARDVFIPSSIGAVRAVASLAQTSLSRISEQPRCDNAPLGIRTWDELRAVWCLIAIWDTYGLMVEEAMVLSSRLIMPKERSWNLFRCFCSHVGARYLPGYGSQPLHPLHHLLNGLFQKKEQVRNDNPSVKTVLVLSAVDLSSVEALHHVSDERLTNHFDGSSVVESLLLDAIVDNLDHCASSIRFKCDMFHCSDNNSNFTHERCKLFVWLQAAQRRLRAWQQRGGTLVTSLTPFLELERHLRIRNTPLPPQWHLLTALVLDMVSRASTVVLADRGATTWFTAHVPARRGARQDVICLSTSISRRTPITERDLLTTLDQWMRDQWEVLSDPREHVPIATFTSPKELFSRLFVEEEAKNSVVRVTLCDLVQ